MQKHPYRIVHVAAGHWDIADATDVVVSYTTRDAARRALADLQSEWLEQAYLHCPTCGDETCPAALDGEGYGQDGTEGPSGPCPHADAND